jgi:putative oxidoreductase
MYPSLLLQSGWGLLVLRMAFGAIMIVHGFPKIKNIRKTGSDFAALGFRPGIVWGGAAAFLELFGGAALVIGIFTVPIAVLFALESFVLMIWKIAKHGAFLGGWEFDLLILASAIALFFSGAGTISLDHLLIIGF